MHLTAPAPAQGYPIPINFPAAAFAAGTPNVLSVPANTDLGIQAMAFADSATVQSFTISASDPITGTPSSTVLKLVPPQVQSVSFLGSTNTPVTAISGVPLGGTQFTVSGIGEPGELPSERKSL